MASWSSSVPPPSGEVPSAVSGGAAVEVEVAAAIDLGSNSFHMIVGRIDEGRLTIVDKLREPVRFASGLDADGNITPEAAERAIACLQRFGQRLDGMPPTRVRAVGTNTLRKARNSRNFMTRAQEALGYDVETISGAEEARLIYLGVAQTMPEQGRRLVVDIGGGSTEVIIGEGFDIVEADSLYMGCVSYSERFFASGITARAFRDAQLSAELELQSIAANYRRLGWDREVGCSGTIHAVHDIVLQNGWSEGGITPRSLKKLRKALIAGGSWEALAIDGLQPDRKPVIAGGVAILEALHLDLRVENMSPSPGALREGVLYDLIGRINHEDVRDRTIRWMQERYQVDMEHAARVEETATTLLGQVTRTWVDLDEAWASQMLSWAARLHEIGLAISHTGYQKHGAYLIRNAHLAGFSRDEQRMVAALVACQRRKLKPEYFDNVPPRLLDPVRRLALIFRLAVRLNRGRDASRPPVVVKVKKNRVRVHFPDGWLEEHPLTQAALADDSRHVAAFGYELSLHEASA
ncbi:MAG: exopolyphosphatase [Myxococcales bacterium]|nr:exopolyphosphatase [Myxococcales bacterium]